MYTKIAKYISWALLILGAVICVLGFFLGFDTSNAAFVDTLLYYAYAICAVAILSILVLIIFNGAKINSKGLLWGALVLVAVIAVLILIFAVSPGNLPDNWNGAEVAPFMLKVTDTFLVLMYALCGVAICSILAAVIVNAVRK